MDYQAISAETAQPIDWEKDNDDLLARKIDARIEDSKPLLEAKRKQYKLSEAYIDGTPDKVDSSRPAMIFNHVFPIVRNMSGLVTDARPHPGVKLVKLPKELDHSQKSELLEKADNLEKSLDDWWEDNKMQSKFQRLVFGLMIFDDFFVMPYWNSKTDDVCVHTVHPRDVRIDPNAGELDEAEYAIVDLFKTRKWILSEIGEIPPDKQDKIMYMDYDEARITESDETSDTTEKKLKSVCKVEMYMESDWFVYKSGSVILKKFRNPTWATSTEDQKKEIRTEIEGQYKKEGVAGIVQKVGDAAKGMVGMDNTMDKIEQAYQSAIAVFKPAENYFKTPRIPLIQFDTYRIAGQLFSKSMMKLSIPTIDNINRNKEAVKKNAENLAQPGVFVAGGAVSEEQAKKIKLRPNQPIRIPTKSNQSIRDVIQIKEGTPLPAQFFEDTRHDELALDNLWGHHEVSKGMVDPANRTKGGILALQDADQTPVRFLTRNIEDSLQDLFNWVVQLRKIYKKDVSIETDSGDTDNVDYATINQFFQVYIRSGSMMPVSRESQRAEALELYAQQAIDPLTLHERLDDPNPDKTARRLEAWLRERRILETDDAQQAVLNKIALIKQDRFEEVQIEQTDDPRVHHDMLVMAIQSNTFSPEQEAFMAQLVQQYAQMAKQPMPQQMSGQDSGQLVQGVDNMQAQA